ncbi:MAG TPA: hypothetical protein VMM76_02710 [Pirellulaceae bacterium]|nr:hypothetical protein [Pirellulaceae bacterium]
MTSDATRQAILAINSGGISMRFNGGPYDERDLPLQPPLARLMRLPQEQELDAFLGVIEEDPAATGQQLWPHVYELDDSVEPAVYRYKPR